MWISTLGVYTLSLCFSALFDVCIVVLSLPNKFFNREKIRKKKVWIIPWEFLYGLLCIIFDKHRHALNTVLTLPDLKLIWWAFSGKKKVSLASMRRKKKSKSLDFDMGETSASKNGCKGLVSVLPLPHKCCDLLTPFKIYLVSEVLATNIVSFSLLLTFYTHFTPTEVAFSTGMSYLQSLIQHKLSLIVTRLCNFP